MPDHHDANLIVQLAQWGSMMNLDEQLAALLADDFDAEGATAEDEAVRRVLQFGETVATLTKNGVLDQGLVLDWLWIQGMWSRVAPAVAKQREKFGEPRLHENFEALASAGTGG